MTDEKAGTVTLTIAHGIATIEFGHPKSNSLPGHLLGKLAEAVSEAARSKDAMVILIQSSGDKAFCAGASFDELAAIDSPLQGKEFFMGFANVLNAMRQSSKFIIVKVQGKVVGGGVGLVAAADYVIAMETASAKLSELALGIGPFVIGPCVRRKIGRQHFSAMTIDTDWRDATWCAQVGLYSKVCSNAEEFHAETEKLVTKLAKSNPEAMQELREIFWRGTDHWPGKLPERAATSGKLVLTDYCQSAIRELQKK